MKKFSEQMQQQLNKMAETGKLFRADISGDTLWSIYLDAFQDGDDPVFRDPESTVHNCQTCNNFIRRYGNIIALDSDLKIMTLFDFAPKTDEYIMVASLLRRSIKETKIANVFFETYEELNSLPYESINQRQLVFQLGIDKNVKRYTKEEAKLYGVVEPNEIRTFNHMYLYLTKQFVLKGKGSIEAIQGKYRDDKKVFQRAMDEISVDTYELVIDLINQGSLVNGDTYLELVKNMMKLKIIYQHTSIGQRDAWCWNKSYQLSFAKFRNNLIGVLCTELSEGMELNKACKNWNYREDPLNKMKPTAPITKRQVNEAKIFVEENGYEGSFKRRVATLEDIKTSEILHLNSAGEDAPAKVSIFDSVEPRITKRFKRSEFDGIEETGIENFMKNILPGCTSVEVLLKNEHEGNMVTMTTGKEGSKSIFKWDNEYSWTFNGNLAGKSRIKTAVKGRGGAVDGVLNIRIAFPGTTNDYDLHVVEPNKTNIYYGVVRQRMSSSGMLDLDANGVDGSQSPENRVENVNYIDITKMKKGDYLIYVNDYGKGQFPAACFIEIEFNGEITSFVIPAKSKAVRRGTKVIDVCNVNLHNGEFSIKEISDSPVKMTSSDVMSKQIYGLDTQEFHKVNLMCLSPNHWGSNKAGHKHYFFMLDKAQAKKSIRSFHNENLKTDLVAYRKVLEVLGATTMVESEPKELSGIGFNATLRDEVILRLKGSHKRMIKVKF